MESPKSNYLTREWKWLPASLSTEFDVVHADFEEPSLEGSRQQI